MRVVAALKEWAKPCRAPRLRTGGSREERHQGAGLDSDAFEQQLGPRSHCWMLSCRGGEEGGGGPLCKRLVVKGAKAQGALYRAGISPEGSEVLKDDGDLHRLGGRRWNR